MKNYNTLKDFEKQRMLKLVESERARLKKPKYWILQQLGLPKSTYYDWVKSGGQTKSKAPKTVWNKTPEPIEKLIESIRDNSELKKSERSFVGIAHNLANLGIFLTSGGVWCVLKRLGKNRKFSESKKIYAIFPKGQRFLDVVCINDVGLTNNKPRELSIFNAIDEYSSSSVAISFVAHRINRYDVIGLLARIKQNTGRYPKVVRLDNARAHWSHAVNCFCKINNIELQFIDKGTPQQNWPVEAFNGVIQKDLLESKFWGGWDDLSGKQRILEEYAEYYNDKKPLRSDPLQRTPREIATGKTSIVTQRRLKIKLIRKYRGQVAAMKEAYKNLNNIQSLFTSCNLSEMCVN